MFQEVVGDSSHVLTVNAFLGCITATALSTVLIKVMNCIAVSVNMRVIVIKMEKEDNFNQSKRRNHKRVRAAERLTLCFKNVTLFNLQ